MASLLKTNTIRMSKRALKVAVDAIQKYYPTKLADKTWDNTGLLVNAAEEVSSEGDNEKIRLLLTVDLTQAVAEEAVQLKSSLIMAYHPFIFKGLKSINGVNDPQQKSLIKLIKNDISVYCPHTAVDSAVGGVNDFLADSIAHSYESTRSVIEPSKEIEGAGMGRIVTLKSPVSLADLVSNVKTQLDLASVQVATNDKNKPISTIAICAGAGGGVFRGVDADLYLTGELSHHEALYLIEKGSSVIACNHSNTERGFLAIMKQQLETEFKIAGFPYEVAISKADKEPYQFWP